jgi:diguanylate cyclase (GGDEF)-like protein
MNPFDKLFYSQHGKGGAAQKDASPPKRSSKRQRSLIQRAGEQNAKPLVEIEYQRDYAKVFWKDGSQPQLIDVTPEISLSNTQKTINRYSIANEPDPHLFVERVMSCFEGMERCSVYLNKERLGRPENWVGSRGISEKQRNVLRHYVTVVKTGEGTYGWKRVGDAYALDLGGKWRKSIDVYQTGKPTIFDYDHNLVLEFTNLDPQSDKCYGDKLNSGETGMKAYFPIPYAKVNSSPVGIVVMEGDLSWKDSKRSALLKGCADPDMIVRLAIERMYLAAYAFMDVACGISDQQHKFDHLTDFAKETTFNSHFKEVVKGIMKQKLQSAFLILIDLDRFKSVNDMYGHLTGNLLIHGMGAAIRGCVKSGDLIARWGGDEFVVLMAGGLSEDRALEAARAIQNNIKALELEIPADEINGHSKRKEKTVKVNGLGSSIGIVNIADYVQHERPNRPNGNGVDELCTKIFGECDRLVYTSKRNGRGKIYFTKVRNGKLVRVFVNASNQDAGQ